MEAGEDLEHCRCIKIARRICAPPLLGSAGHGDNQTEVIGGACLRMTARGPDIEPPWSGSRPPTWEEWVEEG